VPVDWTNIDPSNIQKSKTTHTTGDGESVIQDRELVLGVKPIFGPGKVFRGYPTVHNPVYAAKGQGMAQPIETTLSKDVQVLGVHGVANPEEILGVVHPKDQSVLDSLAKQEAFLVTKSFKFVDVATHPWPIDVTMAQDARLRPSATVRYGDVLGVITSSNKEYAVIQSGKDAQTVPFQDVEPVMVAR